MYPNKKVLDLVGSKIIVEMKGERNILEGMLISADDYLNLYMRNVVEIVNGERSRLLDSVVLRGNNIILINPIE
jgi:small nuclear ribonucleoprotein (snRNP)-like protein